MKMDRKRKTDGGSIVIDYMIANGRKSNPDKLFDLLHKAGYDNDEKDEIIASVLAFLKHQDGDHSHCPRGMCHKDTKCTDTDMKDKSYIDFDGNPKYSKGELDDLV
jgi:hypothetical protein